MNPIMNQWGPVAVIVGGYLLGIFFQNRRIDDLRDSVNRRLDDFRETMNKRFDGFHDLLKSEVKRLEERFDHVDERLERLEHSIVRHS
jgi:predicted nuclease with TOPRIM domain